MSLLIVPVAGRYDGIFQPSQNGSGGASGALDAPVDLGIMDENGYELGWVTYGQDVRDTDAYARTLLDLIYQGADMRLRFRSKEFSTVIMNAAFPWGRTVAPVTITPRLGVIGRRASDITGSVLLTATAGTSAVGNPTTLTASNVVLSPNTNISMNLTSRLRETPVEWVCLPYTFGGDIVWFSCG